VLGLYGGKDQGIPLDTVDKMKGVLAAGSPAAKASQFVVYPEAGHAFHADYRPSYVKSAAEDGWQRALAWFKANGLWPDRLRLPLLRGEGRFSKEIGPRRLSFLCSQL
jgi:carboxymethylenebutenolidase